MAAIAKTTFRCPGCAEPLELRFVVDEDADAAPGELVLKVDRRIIERHIAATHPETASS